MKKLPASCIRFKNIWAVKFPNWVNGIQRQRRSGRAGRRCCCVTSGNAPWRRPEMLFDEAVVIMRRLRRGLWG